jgi:hypothetical protein
MTPPPSRWTALLAAVLTPAVAIAIVLVLAGFGPLRSIGKRPLEGGGWTARTHGWLDFSGFYAAELDDAQRPFNWMSAAGRLRLVRVDRREPLTLSLWVQPAVRNRPVDLTVAVDGIAAPPRRLAPSPQQIDVALPSSDSTRAIVNLSVSESLVPGGTDTRSLGLRVDGIALSPGTGGRLRVPGASIRDAIIAGLALGLGAVLLVGARPLGFALGAGAGAWFGFLLAYDAALLGPYADRVQVIGLTVAATSVIVALVTRGGPEPWSFRAAAGVAITIIACKLALFFHPMATVGDSIFHVHRAIVVQRGEYFFTSITPRPFFEFPYPPGLYVVAGPLWETFRSEMEHVWLLRSIVLAAEGLLGLALYAAVYGIWKNRVAAFLASAFALLIPVGFYTICTSNLTNSFAQSVFGIGAAALLCSEVWPARRWWFIGAGTLLVCGGFLSHFSTFSVGVPLLFACAAALFLGGGASRRAAVAFVIALTLASATSIAVYYAHFMPVYKRTAERVLNREGEAQTRSMVAPPGVKAERVATTVWTEFGAAVLIAAGVAGLLVLKTRARDPLTLVLAGWAAVIVGFWLLGIVTAVEMRASLAAQPLAAIVAAYAIARGFEGRHAYRAAAAVATASMLLHAVSDWIMCLGLPRFWLV